jgi:glycosyltransferase involved in cell wall biosynthesis
LESKKIVEVKHVKIGFLHKVNTTPPKSGGSVHTYQVSRYLAQQGHQLYALDNEKGSQFAQRFPRSFQGLRILIQKADLLYFRVDGRVGWEITSIIPGLFASGKPIVWEINATLEELKVLPSFQRWRDRLGAPLRELSARRVSAALCVSKPLVNYARDLGIERAILVPNGSDPEMFRPDLHQPSVFPGLENKFRVLWAGSTDYSWHDFQTVVACALQIQSIDPEIGFAIVGQQPNFTEQQFPNNIRFYSPVSYLEAPRLFASAHVGLCLYREINWSKYGFFFSPLKLFDYAASGLPVIYSDISELNRVAGSFGLRIAIGDVNGLTQEILRLKQQPNLYARLSQEARQAVLDYYNWTRVGAQTEELLLAVAEGAKWKATGRVGRFLFPSQSK